MKRAGIWSFWSGYSEAETLALLPPAHKVRAERREPSKTAWLIEGPRLPEVDDYDAAQPLLLCLFWNKGQRMAFWRGLPGAAWPVPTRAFEACRFTPSRVTLTPGGDDKTKADCVAKFQNIRRWSGEPLVRDFQAAPGMIPVAKIPYYETF